MSEVNGAVATVLIRIPFARFPTKARIAVASMAAIIVAPVRLCSMMLSERPELLTWRGERMRAAGAACLVVLESGVVFDIRRARRNRNQTCCCYR